jgi:hypothetical protein
MGQFTSLLSTHVAKAIRAFVLSKLAEALVRDRPELPGKNFRTSDKNVKQLLPS